MLDDVMMALDTVLPRLAAVTGTPGVAVAVATSTDPRTTATGFADLSSGIPMLRRSRACSAPSRLSGLARRYGRCSSGVPSARGDDHPHRGRREKPRPARIPSARRGGGLRHHPARPCHVGRYVTAAQGRGGRRNAPPPLHPAPRPERARVAASLQLCLTTPGLKYLERMCEPPTRTLSAYHRLGGIITSATWTDDGMVSGSPLPGPGVSDDEREIRQ